MAEVSVILRAAAVTSLQLHDHAEGAQYLGGFREGLF